jgi:hypothetical protein
VFLLFALSSGTKHYAGPFIASPESTHLLLYVFDLGEIGVVATVDVQAAFDKVDYVFMVGAFPRKDGMERKGTSGGGFFFFFL